MTLKEKFDSISCKDCDMLYCDVKCTTLSDYELNKLEKIADDYAIEFAEYLRINYYETINNCLVSWDNDKDPKTSGELLEIFKKEKGL